MRLLHVIASIDPRGGGPIEAVRRSGGEMCRRGHAVEVLTLDPPSDTDFAAVGLPVHALGPSRGTYAWNPRLVPWLRQRAPSYDAVVVNGLWQYAGLGTRAALHGSPTPYVAFVHGMLDPWFKHAYPAKHLKKSLYWPWGEYRVLRDAAAVLFTCEEERRLARESFRRYRAREAVVSLGTDAPPADAERCRSAFFATRPELRGRRLLTFMGRLHPKKGCDLLLDAFARVAARAPDVSIVMAGPDQAGWQRALEQRAAAAGIAGRVTWTGMLTGDEKWGALYAAEAMVLPSHQENFGFVVAEALGCGVPVLISDKVNIWREVVAAGAGLVAPDTVEGTEQLLTQWLSLEPDAGERMRDAARACFHERFTVGAMAETLERTLDRAIGAARG